MINPFDLPGPQFLQFYLIFGALLCLGLHLVNRSIGHHGHYFGGSLTDPYEIAFLRGGWREAVEVALVSLIDRGLIYGGENYGTLNTKDSASEKLAQRPLEKAILRVFAGGSLLNTLFLSADVQSAAQQYQTRLEAEHLLFNEDDRMRRALAVIFALIALLMVAGVKIMLALQRGRHNFLFLILLVAVFTGLVIYLGTRQRTVTGTAALKKLKSDFRHLKEQSYLMQRGGRTNDAAFLAGVFGVTALPLIIFPYIAELKRRLNRGYTTSAGCSGCGSFSCSGCSGGGGGGCGGGGCGGGCGGCGG